MNPFRNEVGPGQRRYHGAECATCGTNVRYTSTDGCVRCLQEARHLREKTDCKMIEIDRMKKEPDFLDDY
jgi:hypothetical protein